MRTEVLFISLEKDLDDIEKCCIFAFSNYNFTDVARNVRKKSKT